MHVNRGGEIQISNGSGKAKGGRDRESNDGDGILRSFILANRDIVDRDVVDRVKNGEENAVS